MNSETGEFALDRPSFEAKAVVVTTTPWVRRTIEGVVLLVGLLLALSLRWYFFEPAVVISRSMEPALHIGDHFLLDHRASLHGSWQRGDIVLFTAQGAWKVDALDEDTLLKRVIGLPGDTIAFSSNAVFINGRQLVEPYLADPAKTLYQPLELTLGPHQYFVMGDNRNDSMDSRDLGPVDDSAIRGRAVLQLTPLGQWGRFALPVYDNAPANR
jgi:signal peptidase I